MRMLNVEAPVVLGDISVIWHCETNYLLCGHGHLLRTSKSGFSIDQRRMSGHAFVCCQQCKPSTFFFAIVTPEPTPMTTCYEIDQAQYDRWLNAVDDRISSTEMLYLLQSPSGLSYNPRFRPNAHA